MPANRRRVAITAPYDRWVLLGKLLQGRRHVLGYTYRAPEFERDTRVNRRLSADIEMAAPKRVDHFSEGSLRLVAHGYRVPYESMLAVLRGEADELVPAAPAAVPVTRGRLADGPDGWVPPVADPDRRAADAPYAAPILTRLLELADAGNLDPSGAQVFPGSPADAKAWDSDFGKRLPVRDRAWFIAIVRRWEAENSGRAGNSGTGASGA